MYGLFMFKKYLSIAINTVCLCLMITTLFCVIKLNKKLSNKSLTTQMQLFSVREQLVKFLKVYLAYDNNGAIELARHGKSYDGGYVVAVKALNESDILLGYGIDTDNSFEDQYSVIYGKPSYGFDCGIQHIDSKSKLFTLVKECIASGAYLYNKSNSNYQISSFEQQLDKLKLKNKKIFVKMDIEGAEYDAFPEIINNQNNITGISLEIHLKDLDYTKKALHLLKQLDKHFVLLHVHGNNCCINSGFSTTNSIGVIPSVIELSYINKSLVTNFVLSKNQFHPLKIDQPNIESAPEAVFEILLD